MCDGDRDCAGGEDEDICSSRDRSLCRADQFQCQNFECIPLHLKCSGQAECRDHSDEDLIMCCKC